MKFKVITLLIVLPLLIVGIEATAGALNPDCSAKKSAKSATMKATVGVGGRCSPAEAAKDTAKGAVGVDEIDPLKTNKNPLKKENKNKKKKLVN